MLHRFYKFDNNMGSGLEWLNIVAKKHDEWIKIVNSFGEYNYAEDLVQQMYLALAKYTTHDKIIKDGEVRRGYVFFTLRSLYYQYYNKKKKINKVSLDDQDYLIQIPDETDYEEQEAFHRICVMVDDLSEGWHWYDKKIWRLYSRTDMSIRKLASETKISWVSIFNTLKGLKEEIKEKISEDYEDFKNQDYDKL